MIGNHNLFMQVSHWSRCTFPQFQEECQLYNLEQCPKTRLKMYSARSVNRLLSIVTAGHGPANSAISAWCVECSLPIVVVRESRRDHYAMPAVASCIYTIMTKILCVSGARDILTAGRTRKYQVMKPSLVTSAKFPISEWRSISVDPMFDQADKRPSGCSRHSRCDGLHKNLEYTPGVTGLYTILIPMTLFALFSSSRHLVDSATAAWAC